MPFPPSAGRCVLISVRSISVLLLPIIPSVAYESTKGIFYLAETFPPSRSYSQHAQKVFGAPRILVNAAGVDAAGILMAATPPCSRKMSAMKGTRR